MKVGIIRCQQTEDRCLGNADLKVASEGKFAFQEMEPSEIIILPRYSFLNIVCRFL